MYYELLFLLFTFCQGRKYEEFEKVAIGSLAEQTLKAFENSVQNCIQNGKRTKAESGDIQLLVWDSFGEANEMIQDMAKTRENVNKETVIIADDIGKDTRSSKTKKLVKKILKKKPKAKVVSVDWGTVVSIICCLFS